MMLQGISVMAFLLLPAVNSQLGNLIYGFKKSQLPLREDFYLGNKPIFESYDYVIVGASPAGCVLANRLSSNPNHTVLLLEAGPESNTFPDIPIFNLLMYNTEFNWAFYSQFNPNVCNGMEQKTCAWPSGRGIGGGSIFNALMYTRGNKWDYDQWAAAGNVGWSYEELLPYWRRLESVEIQELSKSSLRGTSGPVKIQYPNYRSKASEVFLEAGRELGYPIIDYNTPYKEGFARIQMTSKNGERYNSRKAYLDPIRLRRNLHIVQRAIASKILIDEDTKVATGIEFIKKKKKRLVQARREVVISAGSFGTPKLLMLSGIGHKKHLEFMGIQVIQDLPVGDNLMEHLGTNILSFTTNSSEFTYGARDIIPNMLGLFTQYLEEKSGKLAASGIESLAYIKTKYARSGVPDVEILFTGTSVSDDYGSNSRRAMAIRDDIYDAYWKPLEKKDAFGMWVMGCYPKSRGTVRLASPDPYDPPIIKNNFLQDEEDLAVIVEGLKKILDIANAQAMKKYGVELYSKPLPGCEMFKYGSDEYWGCTVRQITIQYHHQSGTCKMGPYSDPESVVDPTLKVKNIKQLRVADMSIAPLLPAGHTMATAYMIGEKAADLIIKDTR